MPSAAFLAVIDQPSAYWYVLAQIEAREKLHGDWTSAGSGAYTRDWAPYTHPATLRDDLGLYRQLTSVRHNGTALTSRADLATLQAAANGYFWDEANQSLAVKLTGSVNPDTVSLVDAVFVLRVSNGIPNLGAQFSDEPPYAPLIDGQSLPSLRMEVGEVPLGINVFPAGALTVVNADGLWDYIAKAYRFANATVQCYVGANAMDFDDYEPIEPLQVPDGIAAGNLTATLQMRSFSNATEVAFPQSRFEEWDATIANIQGYTGKYMPMLFGSGYDMPLWLHSEDGGSLSWDRYYTIDPFQIASGHGVQAIAVYAYPKVGGARQTVPTTDWAAGFANGFVDVNDALWPAADWDFTFDGYTSTFPGAAPVWYTFGTIARAILEGVDAVSACNIPPELIDTAAFAQADLDAPQTLGLYIPGGAFTDVATTGTELLNRLERSVFGTIHPAADFVYTAQVWDPSYDLASCRTISERDRFSRVPAQGVRSPLATEITVEYARRERSGQSEATTASSTEALADQGRRQTLPPVETCLTNEVDAATYARRLLLIHEHRTEEFEIETGPGLMGHAPWDKIRVQGTRGPSFAGSFDEPMEITRIMKRLSGPSVSVTVGNMRGLGSKVRRLAPNGTPGWANATPEERLAYGFLLDNDTERADPADPATYRLNILW